MNELVLKDFGGTITVTPDAYELRRKALELAQQLKKVETPEQQQFAVDALRDLKALRSGMEQTRKTIKAPVLDLGRKIDATASEFMQDVEKQYGRLTGLINHYQRKLQEVKDAEAAKVNNQVATAAELRAKAAAIRAEAGISNTGNTKRLLAEQLEQQAFDLEMKAELAVIPTSDKPKGLVVRNKINFQVEDPIVFAQAWPQYWKATKNGDHENECLVVDRMRVLDELNKEGGGEFHATRFPEELPATEDRRLVRPAGLRVYEDLKAHIR